MQEHRTMAAASIWGTTSRQRGSTNPNRMGRIRRTASSAPSPTRRRSPRFRGTDHMDQCSAGGGTSRCNCGRAREDAGQRARYLPSKGVNSRLGVLSACGYLLQNPGVLGLRKIGRRYWALLELEFLWARQKFSFRYQFWTLLEMLLGPLYGGGIYGNQRHSLAG
jgi:hypothetical protein